MEFGSGTRTSIFENGWGRPVTKIQFDEISKFFFTLIKPLLNRKQRCVQ